MFLSMIEQPVHGVSAILVLKFTTYFVVYFLSACDNSLIPKERRRRRDASMFIRPDRSPYRVML
jgi:hypothetical protein